jgi:ribosomal protein S18 acetylase RimI-like enzyme
MSEIEYVELDKKFAKEIASIHANSLSEDVLPSLGLEFLVQYYQYVLTDRTQLIIGALSQGVLVGFCQLSFSPIKVTNILHYIPSAIFSIAKLAVLNARQFLNGIIQALNSPKKVLKSPQITFIAVRPDFQGQGIGNRLVKEVNKIAAKQGKSQIITKTSNEIARSMYEKTFKAHVISTVDIMGKRYWYLSWYTNALYNRSDV